MQPTLRLTPPSSSTADATATHREEQTVIPFPRVVGTDRRSPHGPSAQITSRVTKRTIDLLVASAALLLAAPVLLAAAIAIRLDSPGPVVFSQVRIGRDGRRFRILKLRTMAHGCSDAAHAEYVRRLAAGRAEAHGGLFKLVDDPRITRVGRTLRSLSIDELPQLLNVLRGEMSLVGPRPMIEREVALLGRSAALRQAVRPGITGPWQVAGRSTLDFREMVGLDLAYARGWSVWGDLRILARTPAAVLSRKGAA